MKAGGNLCGNSWTERVVHGSVFVPHVGSTVTVSFKSSMDEGKDNESFGVYNLRILTTYCATCAVAAQEFTDKKFTGG